FSSRRRHTRSKRDWSSDVCSSDLSSACTVSSTSTPTQPWASSGSMLVSTWSETKKASTRTAAGPRSNGSPAGICGGGASSTVRNPPRPATSAGTSTSTASTTRRGQVRTRARAAARTPLVRAGAGLLVTAFLRHGVSSWQKRTHPIRPMGRPLHRIDVPNNDEGAPLATKTIVELRDDLDGGPAQHTGRSALEDWISEIDLNSTNRDKLV